MVNDKYKNEGAPVYAVIAAEIRERIIGGNLRPGDLLPSENELRTRHTASRETVRKSLKELENEGYIYSRPGKGYYVSHPAYSRFSMELEEDSENTAIRHVTVISPSAEIASALEMEKKRRVIEIIRVTYRKNRPIACELRYLPYDQGKPTIESDIDYAVFPEVAVGKTSAFALHTRMNITSEKINEKAAQYLECSTDSVLLTVRRYLIGSDNEPLGYAIRYMLPACGGLSAVSGIGFKK